MNIFKGILSGSVDLLNLPILSFYSETIPGYILDEENLKKDWQQICDYGLIARKMIENNIERSENKNE